MRGGTYFLCRRKESRQRKRLTPLVLKRVSWLGGPSGASGIRALAHSTPVTRQSFFRRRCARRRGASLNRSYGSGARHRCRAKRCVPVTARDPISAGPADGPVRHFQTHRAFRRAADAKQRTPPHTNEAIGFRVAASDDGTRRFSCNPFRQPKPQVLKQPLPATETAGFEAVPSDDRARRFSCAPSGD